MSRGQALFTILLVIVLFFGVNILADSAFRSARVDLTEQGLYTLTDGTRTILREIEEPIRLRLYWSRSAAAGTSLEAYGKRVREMLEEYELASGSAIELEVIEPEPDSEAADEATAFGLASPRFPGGPVYLGLVGTNSTDGREVIPFFSPQEERFLEYNVTRLIYTLANPDRPVVGVISSLPVDGSPGNQFAQQQPRRPWRILAELRQLYDVRVLPPDTTLIDGDVSLLLLIHPKSLGEETLYAIDQFVLRGGRLAAFVDPLCEADVPPGAAQNPFAAANFPRRSDLGPLFEAWGVELAQGQVAADINLAMAVGADRVPYIAYLMLGSEEVNPDDAVTGQIGTLIMGTAGVLDQVEGAQTEFTPLVTTTEESMRLGVDNVRMFPQPRELLADFAPGGRELVLAARVSGEVSTAFPAGPPGGGDAPEGDGEAGQDDEGHLASSRGPINVVVVADADMASDPFWVREIPIGRQSLYQKVSDNGDFIVNVADNLAGSSALISIRARGTFARPFTRVERIRREAEARYLAEEQRIDEEIRETERRINDRGFATSEGGEIVLTAEQQAELERLRRQLAEARRQKREIRYKLREDVERLGLALKVVNIGVIPALVALAAVGIGAYRLWARSGKRAAAARAG